MPRLSSVVVVAVVTLAAGRYTYDAPRNRAVAVAASAIIESLDKVYGARRVLEELRAP